MFLLVTPYGTPRTYKLMEEFRLRSRILFAYPSCPWQVAKSVRIRPARAKIILPLLEIFIFPPEVASSVIKCLPFLFSYGHGRAHSAEKVIGYES